MQAVEAAAAEMGSLQKGLHNQQLQLLQTEQLPVSVILAAGNMRITPNTHTALRGSCLG